MIYGKALQSTKSENGDELHTGSECGWKISSTSLSDKIDVQKAEVSKSDITKNKRQLCHQVAEYIWFLQAYPSNVQQLGMLGQ